MKVISGIIAMAVVAGALGYQLLQTERIPATAAVTLHQPQGVSGQLDSLETLADLLEVYHADGQLKFTEVYQQQLKMNAIVEDLNGRLKVLEHSSKEFSTTEGAEETPLVQINELASDDIMAEPQPARKTDAEVGQILDSTLQDQFLDEATSSRATEQVTVSLQDAPGVNLDDMRCGDRFCRATFSHVNGESPAIDKLLGHPPFVHEGFSVYDAEGRVKLYFNQPGQSLQDLRSELIANGRISG